MTAEQIPVFIAHEDGIFKEHILSTVISDDNEDETVCGIRWADLPNNRDSETGEEWVDDKPWYYDHDRKDVVICTECLHA